MKSALASLGKNTILLAVLLFSTYNYVYGAFYWKDVLSVQLFAGLVYIFLSCYEYLNASYKAALPVQRYPYFSSQFFMFRTLKVGVFVSFAILLLISGSKVKYLYPICLIIALTEAVTTILKFKNNLCFVNIYANYLLIMQHKMTKVFASEIILVEFRHDIFYFVKKDRKTVEIKMEHVREKEKFVQALHVWIVRNKLMLSEESRTKIEQLITF